MPALDVAVDHEVPTADRAVPDIVITAIVTHELAAGLAEHALDFLRVAPGHPYAA